MLARDLFWFAAGLMASLAGILVAIPLLRARSGEASASSRGALVVAAAAFASIAVCIVGLYLWLGTPTALETTAAVPAGPPEAPHVSGSPADGGGTPLSMEEATARLAARLDAGGGTRDDWLLLAQSYDFLGRSEEAAAARRQAGTAPAGKTGAPAATVAAAARIEGLVELAPGLRGRDSKGAVLFIYARQIGAGGPPLAVLRVPADAWPVSFVLDDGNAMVPGRNLSSAETVLLEARVSRSGNAMPQSGDLVGTIPSINPRAGKPVRIAIDRVIG